MRRLASFLVLGATLLMSTYAQ
ncbi:MAG: hypothetical protein RLZ42_559, partial [Armatimonadota bacterium]